MTEHQLRKQIREVVHGVFAANHSKIILHSESEVSQQDEIVRGVWDLIKADRETR